MQATKMGETIMVYAPFDHLFDSTKGFSEDAQKNMKHVFLALKRAIFSMDKPPKFYILIISNVKGFGVDIHQAGFVPDIVKTHFNLISFKEAAERVIYSVEENDEALGDYEGTHVRASEIILGEFLTSLILQKLNRKFSDKKIKEFMNVKNIDANYDDGIIHITINIVREKYHPSFSSPSEETKKVVVHFLKIYQEFLADIKTIEIDDQFYEMKHTYTPEDLLNS